MQFLCSVSHEYVCRKRSFSHNGEKTEAGKGKGSEKKKKKTEPKQQPEQGVDDDAAEYDDSKEDWQIMDFDKLINKLKFEKKLVEICIPQSAPASKKKKVYHAFKDN